MVASKFGVKLFFAAIFCCLYLLGLSCKTANAVPLPAESVFDVFVELQQALHTVDLKHLAKLVDNQAGLKIVLKDTNKDDFVVKIYPFQLERLKRDDRLLDTEPPLPLYTIFYGRQRVKGGELRARADFANPGLSRPLSVELGDIKRNQYQTIKWLISDKKYLLENRSRWLIFWIQETPKTASLHRWQIDEKFNLLLSSQDYVLHKINGYWYVTEMEIFPGRP